MGVRERNPGALNRLQARIRRVCEAGFRVELAQKLAAAATKQVADEFQQERDPYGRPWRALAKGSRPAAKLAAARILRLSGRMAASAAGVPSSSGFTFHMAFPARIHQLGGPIIPQRQLLPMASTGGLGPIWGPAFYKEAGDLLRLRLGRST